MCCAGLTKELFELNAEKALYIANLNGTNLFTAIENNNEISKCNWQL